MLSAQMIAKAWMDETYHAQLISQGLKVPARPDDLGEDHLDLLTGDNEVTEVALDTPICC